MKPLREEIDASDPFVARAAQVVRSAQEIRLSPLRKDQLKAELLMTRSSRSSAGAHWLLRPAVAFAVLIGIAAVASAMFEKVWIERHSIPPKVELLESVELSAPLHRTVVQPAQLQIPTVALLARAQRSVMTREVVAAHESVPAPTLAAEPPIAVPPTSASAPPIEEASLLARATRTLRREHDPVASQLILGEYFRKYPQGELTEEALAIAIEAATDQNDSRAVLLAGHYLEAYPNGRFRVTAESARRHFQK